MAYMNQVLKLAKAPIIKFILKRYGLKGSLSVQHNSTLVLTITEGVIDFVANANRCGNHNNRLLTGFTPFTSGYMQVNPYWYHEHFDGKARDFLHEVIYVMNIGNHNNSNAQVDYFDVGWYISINVGKWNKPYQVIKG